jgi:transcriptional regulator with XRE-family HTH domain
LFLLPELVKGEILLFSKELFGQRMKEIRLKADVNQTDFGLIIGTRKSHVSEIESGTACTTVEGLAALCKHYNVSADYLLGLTDEPRPYKRKKN